MPHRKSASRSYPTHSSCPRGAASLPQLFAAGELDAITINYPTPQPKAKYAKKRLVHVDHLMIYRPLFAAGATVTLRTDSKPLRDYAWGSSPRQATTHFG